MLATGAYTYVPTPDANGTDSVYFQGHRWTVASNVAQVDGDDYFGERRAGGKRWRAYTAEDTTGSGTLTPSTPKASR